MKENQHDLSGKLGGEPPEFPRTVVVAQFAGFGERLQNHPGKRRGLVVADERLKSGVPGDARRMERERRTHRRRVDVAVDLLRRNAAEEPVVAEDHLAVVAGAPTEAELCVEPYEGELVVGGGQRFEQRGVDVAVGVEPAEILRIDGDAGVETAETVGDIELLFPAVDPEIAAADQRPGGESGDMGPEGDLDRTAEYIFKL